jgi:hypothetical protein
VRTHSPHPGVLTNRIAACDQVPPGSLACARLSTNWRNAACCVHSAPAYEQRRTQLVHQAVTKRCSRGATSAIGMLAGHLGREADPPGVVDLGPLRVRAQQDVSARGPAPHPAGIWLFMPSTPFAWSLCRPGAHAAGASTARQ